MEITPWGTMRKKGKQTVTEIWTKQPKWNTEWLTLKWKQSIPEWSTKLKDNFEMKK
jgi:hypothetical protein